MKKKHSNSSLFSCLMLCVILCVSVLFVGCDDGVLPPQKYTVTFQTNGGSKVDSQQIEAGQKVAFPVTPTRQGFAFGGWFSDADLSVTWNFETAVTQNMTLYAAWTASVDSSGDVLVAFFSCTNTTKAVAEKIATLTNGTLYQIQPKVPYTSDDLNYNKSDSRANREQQDSRCRPEIEGALQDFSHFNTVFLGFPIWWGKMPKIMFTFLESYDFSDKTIVPFCTSGSSGIAASVAEVKQCQPNAFVDEGKRFGSGATTQQVQGWLDSLSILVQDSQKEEITLKITIGSTVLEAELEKNSSAEALVELLKKGSITIDMHDYSNFEKVGSLPQSLPRNDEQTTTRAGDLILYLGNQFVIYYDTNSWNFTRLGKIKNITQSQLKAILGDGNVTVTLSL